MTWTEINKINQILIQIFCNQIQGMIPSTKPKYRIKYKPCGNKKHGEQLLNFVCLNETCCENSLVCSICREDDHKGHPVQPLKHYIQLLKKQYQQSQVNYEKQFEDLQLSRISFLIKLRESVEKVAMQFQKLEQDIVDRFELLKKQIIQNQSKKNKFPQFYQSIILESEDNPLFLIQNYLPSKQIPPFDKIQSISEMGLKLCTTLQQVRTNLFLSDSKEQFKVASGLKFEEKLASTIIHLGNIYTQTNFDLTNLQTLSGIVSDLANNFENTRIKIKVNKLKKGGSITIGAIEKQFFKSLNNQQPVAGWNSATYTGKVFCFNSQWGSFGHSSGQLKAFSENSNIEISMSGKMMKIGMKKYSSEYKLPEGQFYFFFNLQGQTEIEVTYCKK